MSYACWVLNNAADGLHRVPPRYPRVVAHHVTYAYPGDTCPPDVGTVTVIGIADDGVGVQALVVEVAGEPYSPDGRRYHITWSLAEGRTPVESNRVIALGYTAVDPFELEVTGQVLP